MPRPVIPGEKRALNKRVVERLADELYGLEISGGAEAQVRAAQVWALRKAAWAIEDLPQDLGLVYRSLGMHGIESIPGVGPKLARKVCALMADLAGKERQ